MFALAAVHRFEKQLLSFSKVQDDPTLFTDEGFLDKQEGFAQFPIQLQCSCSNSEEEDEKIYLVQPILLLLREIFGLKVGTDPIPTKSSSFI